MVPKLIINVTPGQHKQHKTTKNNNICEIPQKLPNNALHNTLPVKKRETFE